MRLLHFIRLSVCRLLVYLFFQLIDTPFHVVDRAYQVSRGQAEDAAHRTRDNPADSRTDNAWQY